MTYTGVASGSDNGVFGSNAAYVDTPFVAHYRFDETDVYQGFPLHPAGFLGNFLGADFTINGFELSLAPPISVAKSGDGTVAGYARLDSLQFIYLVPSNIGALDSIAISNAISTGLAPAGRTDAFSAAGVNLTGIAAIWNTLNVVGPGIGASFSFANASVTVASTPSTPPSGRGVFFSAIPEPSTWGLLSIGIFGIGGALRRNGPRARFAVS